VRDYRSLIVWERAHALTLSVFEATHRFPGIERFGLAAQLRRASASIGSNIAEGCGRHSTAEFVRFLTIAAGSASEAQYQLELAHDLGYLASNSDLLERAHEVKRMLYALIERSRPD
jgi:four helix bundle protein